jgi:hypothetical protein
MKKIILISAIIYSFILNAQIYPLSPNYITSLPTAGLVRFNTYNGTMNSSTSSTVTQFQLSDVPINLQAGTCTTIPNSASNFLSISFTDQQITFPSNGTYRIGATGCKLLSCSLYNPNAIPANVNAQSGNITANFISSNTVSLNGSITFMNNRGTVNFRNLELKFLRCGNPQTCTPNSYPNSISISQPTLPITYNNIVGKWKEIDYWENGIRKLSFVANTFQQCLNSSNRQGYYSFGNYEKQGEYKYLGIIRQEYFDGIPVKKILFENEDFPVNGRLMSNYIKNNTLYYFESENCGYKEIKLENGDFVKVTEDNGCIGSNYFNKKGLYIYNNGVFSFHSVNTTFNPCNKILSYGAQKTTFSDNSSNFKIESGVNQTRLIGNYTDIINSYPPVYLNNSRRSLPTNIKLNITLLTQSYMEIEYLNSIGVNIKVRLQRIP